jgi:hypothetical protein
VELIFFYNIFILLYINHSKALINSFKMEDNKSVLANVALALVVAIVLVLLVKFVLGKKTEVAVVSGFGSGTRLPSDPSATAGTSNPNLRFEGRRDDGPGGRSGYKPSRKSSFLGGHATGPSWWDLGDVNAVYNEQQSAKSGFTRYKDSDLARR